MNLLRSFPILILHMQALAIMMASQLTSVVIVICMIAQYYIIIVNSLTNCEEKNTDRYAPSSTVVGHYADIVHSVVREHQPN